MDRKRLPGRALAGGSPGPGSHLGMVTVKVTVTVMVRDNCATSQGRKKDCTGH